MERCNGACSAAVLQRPPEPANDDAAGAVVGGRLDPVVDVEHERRHVVVPVEMSDGFRREPAAMVGIHNARLRPSKARRYRRESAGTDPCRRNDALCDAFRPIRRSPLPRRGRGTGRVRSGDARRSSARCSAPSAWPEYSSIMRMRAATLISSPWIRTALAPFLEKAAERAVGLIADQQHGGLRCSTASVSDDGGCGRRRTCRWRQ